MLKEGSQAYIVTNGIIEPVIIMRVDGNYYTVRYVNKESAIRVPSHRIYNNMEEINKKFGLREERGTTPKYNPLNYY